MKFLTILVFIISACQGSIQDSAGTEQETATAPTTKQLDSSFQQLLDEAQVKGSILIYNRAENTYYSNDFNWASSRKPPASTFKIVNSIIALELGIVEDDSTFFQWDGVARRLSFWDRDMFFRDAYHLSCVPIYQEIARKIGVSQMIHYTKIFDYGEMDIRADNIDLFWLTGESGISCMDQIDFLKKFHEAKLPIKKRTERIMKDMMILDSENGKILRGKTGWSSGENYDNGWFVGYQVSGDETSYIAVNIEPLEGFDMGKFANLRMKLGLLALQKNKQNASPISE